MVTVPVPGVASFASQSHHVNMNFSAILANGSETSARATRLKRL